MSLVWEARDERLDRTVAVKQLHPQPHLSEAEAELANRRAMREARITARLIHPHAVLMFDVVEHQGQPCLILQFLPCEPLAALIQRLKVLTPEETARIGAQVASALRAAHHLGIVHRDVKPGNVLIADDGTARISDFGISHALGDVTLTATGLVHGTPAFLAPEVARGGESGFASDVYGLGATLYAAVEGAPPFGTGQNPIGLLRKVASGHFDPPRRSGQLTPLLLGMLSADPEDRPSMGEVTQRTAHLVHHEAAVPTDAPRGAVTSTLRLTRTQTEAENSPPSPQPDPAAARTALPEAGLSPGRPAPERFPSQAPSRRGSRRVRGVTMAVIAYSASGSWLPSCCPLSTGAAPRPPDRNPRPPENIGVLNRCLEHPAKLTVAARPHPRDAGQASGVHQHHLRCALPGRSTRFDLICGLTTS